MFDVPPPHAADVAVRAGADAPPVAAGPVEQVVPASPGRRGGPVRDLVPAEPGGRQRRLRGQVAVRGHVVGRLRQLAAADPGGQPGAVLHDQGVRADVVDTGVDRGGQRGGEVVGGLTRRPVDQVQVDVREAGLPGLGRGLGRPPRRVLAVEDAQHAGRDRLHAQRDPGVAGGPQRAQALRRDRLRVGLGGHLGVGGEPPGLVDGGQDPAQVVGGQQGGRAAADEDRVDRRCALQGPRRELELGQHGVGVALGAPARQVTRRVRVEVAVAAPQAQNGTCT